VIENVFIPCDDDGEFLNVALFNAATGFEFLGHPVTRMTGDEILGRTARPQDLVFGGVDAVRPYLAKLGCEPLPIDYPDAVLPSLKRTFSKSTLREIRRLYNEPGDPVFIKPVEHKLFTGHTVRRFGDLLRTQNLDADTPIYVVEHVEFVSEWRFYIEGQEVVGVDHYKGDPCKFPHPTDPKETAVRWSKHPEPPPAAYSLDFGVRKDGETCLVEVNDMISLGCYGLDAPVYARLIIARWLQLVESLLP